MKKLLQSSLIIFYILIISTVNAQNWTELGTGSNALQTGYGAIIGISSDSNGNVYAIGGYYDSNSKTYVAKWNGSSWSKLGNFAPYAGTLTSLCTDKNGNVYVGGDIVNSNSSYFVNKWDGTSWSEVGGLDALDANASVDILVADDAGNIYATGDFTDDNGQHYVAKWDGTSWTEVGGLNSLNPDGPINVMTTDRAGNVYVAGNIQNEDNGSQNVYKWDGTSWLEIGSPANTAVFGNDTQFSSIGVTPTGDIYVGTDHKNSNGKYYVTKWDGANWSELPVETADEHSIVHVDYNGYVYTTYYVEANPQTAQYTSNIRKLNGTSWNQLGYLNGSNIVYKMYSDKKGNLFVGGLFQDATPNTYIAEYANASTSLSVVKGTYADNNIKIYPNPAQDVITVDVPSDLINTPYYIYDSRGVLHTSGVLPAATSTLNVDQLSTGLYFVQVGDLSKNAYKLVKK